MRRLFLVFLLCSFCTSWAATRVFTDSLGTHLWSAAGNWHNALPASGDSCFDSAGTCSTDVDIHVKSIYCGNSANFKFGSAHDTVNNYFRWSSSGNATGNSKYCYLVKAGTGIGAVTFTSGTTSLDSCFIYLMGNDSFTVGSTNVFYGLSCAYSGKTTTSYATVDINIRGNSAAFVTNGGNLVTNMNTSKYIYIRALNSCNPISWGTGTIWTGNNVLWIAGIANKKVTVPYFKYAGSTYLKCLSATLDTIVLVDSIDAEALSIGINTTGTKVFKSNNAKIKSGSMNLGGGNAGYNGWLSFDSSVVQCSTVVYSGNALYNDSLKSSQWTIRGSISLSSPSYLNLSSGTSTITFVSGLVAKTITSTGNIWNNIVINQSTTQKLTFIDSLQAYVLTQTNGKLKDGGQNTRLSGDFLMNSTTTTDTVLLSGTVTQKAAATLHLGWNTIQGQYTAATFNPQGNTTIQLEQHKRTIGRLICVSGKTYTQDAGDTLAIQNHTQGNIDGAIFRSGTPGTYTYDSLPASVSPIGINLKDVYNVGNVGTPDSTSQNWGHNYGFIWRKARLDSVTFSFNHHDSISTRGGDTARFRGKYFGYDGNCVFRFGASNMASTVSNGDTLAIKISPAKTAGIYAVYATTSDSASGGDSAKDTLLSYITYVAPPGPLSYASSPVIDSVNKAASHAITNSGGAADSFTVSPALPSGLSITKSTGLISGTPLVATAKAGYKVKAWSVFGNDSCYDTITVVLGCVYDTLARFYGVTDRRSYNLSVPCSTLAKMTCDSVKVYLQSKSATSAYTIQDSTVWTKTVLKDTLTARHLFPDKAYTLRLKAIAKLSSYVDTLSTKVARTRALPKPY